MISLIILSAICVAAEVFLVRVLVALYSESKRGRGPSSGYSYLETGSEPQAERRPVARGFRKITPHAHGGD